MLELTDYILSIADIGLCFIDIGIIIYFFFYRSPVELSMVKAELSEMKWNIRTTNDNLNEISHNVNGIHEWCTDVHYDGLMIREELSKFNRFKVKPNRKFFRKIKNK